MFNDALNYLGKVASNKGKILFVGTKRAAGSIVKEEATRAGQYFVDKRWLGGMLTNYKTIRVYDHSVPYSDSLRSAIIGIPPKTSYEEISSEI